MPFILPPLSVPEKQDLLPLTKYETLPTFGNSPDSSFYKAASSSLFTEVNVFTGIHTGSRGKENPLALVNNAVFIAGFLETDEDDWDTLSLISADITSGKVKWQARVGSYFIATDSKRVFAEFPKGGNTGIDAFDINSGDTIWQTPLPYTGIDYLALTGHNLSVKIINRRQGAFYVLDPASGKIQESRKKTNLDQADFTFMIDDGTTYEWFGNSITASGKNEWKTEFVSDQQFFDRELAAPVVTDKLILIRWKYPTYSPIVAIDRQTSSVIWQIDSTAVSNLAVDGSITYFVTKEAVLLAVETQTGKILGSLKFTPAFGEDFYFPNSSILVAAHSNTIAVYFEDKGQLSIFRFEAAGS